MWLGRVQSWCGPYEKKIILFLSGFKTPMIQPVANHYTNSVTKAIQFEYNILNDLSVVCGCGMADVVGTLSAFLRGQLEGFVQYLHGA